jgi:hypothetical protein
MSVFSSIPLLKEWVVGKFYNNGQHLITGQDAQDGFANVIDTLAALVVPVEYPFTINNAQLNASDDYSVTKNHNLNTEYFEIIMFDQDGNGIHQMTHNAQKIDADNVKFKFFNDIGTTVYSGKIIAR